jgi:O-antigen/teichoic acid export membrane protein
MHSQEASVDSARHTARKASAKKHMRGSALLLVGRGIGIALNFAVQVLVVRHLAKADYGAFAYAISLMLFGSHVVGLGLAKGVNRYAPIYQERRQFDAMAGTVVLALGAVLGVGLALVLLVMGVVQLAGSVLIADPLALSLVLIVICLAPLQALDEISVKLFAIFASARALFLRRHVLGPGLKLAAVLALIACQGDAVFLAVAYVVTGVLGTGLSLAIIAGVLRKQDLLGYFRPGRLRIPARSVLRYSLPLITSDVVTALRSTLVVVFLGFFHGAVAVAAFRSVLPVARLNGMVFDSFKLLFVPSAARMYASGDREGISELYWRTASWITVVSFPIFAVSFCLAEPVTVLLFGNEYADSAPVLSLLSLGLFANSVFGANTLVLRVFRRVRAIVAIDTSMIALAVIANLVFVWKYGAMGGAISSFVVLIARNVLYQLQLARVEAVRPPDAGFLLVAFTAFAMAGCLWVVQALLDIPLLLGGLLAALGSLALLWVSAPRLEIRETFPELTRLRAARRFLRIAEEK